MKRSFFYLLRAFYARDQYSKYQYSSPYFGALLQATILIVITLLFFVFVASCMSPEFYHALRRGDAKIDGRLVGGVVVGVIYLLLRVFVKEDAIRDTTMERWETKRVAAFCIVYGMSIGVAIIVLGLKYLKK